MEGPVRENGGEAGLTGFGMKEYVVAVQEIYEQFFKEDGTQRSDMASQYTQLF